jgi:hypothetical protein
MTAMKDTRKNSNALMTSCISLHGVENAGRHLKLEIEKQTKYHGNCNPANHQPRPVSEDKRGSGRKHIDAD